MNMIHTDSGQGRCVFFLHGWGGGLASFSHAAKSLESKIRVVNIEFDKPKNGEVWGIADYAKSVIDLADSLDIKMFSVVGHSFGGRCAIFLAANYSERIEKTVLVDSAGLKPRRGPLYHYKVFKYKRLKKNGGNVAKMGSSDYLALDDNMKKTFVRIVNEDLSPLLKKISCTTLIIFGKKDNDTPPYMARKLKRGIKNSAIVWLKGGHYAYVEEYNVFIEILRAFLD